MHRIKISLDDIDALVFDFDGVLTNNLVHLDQDGREWVSCNRADGLAFDVLNKLQKPAYILSTEKNITFSEKIGNPAQSAALPSFRRPQKRKITGNESYV